MNVRFPNFASARAGLFASGLIVAAMFSGCVLDATGASNGKQTTDEPAATDAAVDLDAAAPTHDAGASPQRDALVHDAQATSDADATQAASDARSEDAPPPADATTPTADAALVQDAQADASFADAEASSDASATAVDARVDASVPAQCPLPGFYAVQLDYDIEWRGTNLAGVLPLLRAGSGLMRIWMGMELRENGDRLRARGHGCGATLPDFAAMNARIGTELYGFYFPNESWDHPAMPRWDVDLMATCRELGCAISSSPFVGTLGARITPNNPWPGPNGSLAQFMVTDIDGDGIPGMALISRTPAESSASGVPYIQVPLAWTQTPRASRLSMAIQVAFQLDGEVDKCGELSGLVNLGRVENRVLNCVGKASAEAPETACTPEQVTFADRNLPEWKVTGGRWRAQRIADAATCGDVRAALR